MEYQKQWIIIKKKDKEYLRNKFGIKRLPKEGREIIHARQVGLNSFSIRKKQGFIILSILKHNKTE